MARQRSRPDDVSRETSPRAALSEKEFAALPHVSRETLADFKAWKALLDQWNRRINLVSPGAMADFWGRHALDSWQLAAFLPEIEFKALDLGSGAGFPGLALAIAAKQKKAGHVTLVESVGKKANFLRTVIRELGLPASVWAGRAEDLEPSPYNIISARAFAPLPRLLTYAQPFWGDDTTALLLKGQNWQDELTEAAKTWTFKADSSPSQSDPEGVILQLRGLTPQN